MTRHLAGSVLMLTALLAGCGGGAETDEPPSVSSSAPSPEAASPSPDVDVAVGSPETTSCEDTADDSTGVVDLATVGLVPGPDEVEVSYAWSGQVPSVGSVLWVTTVASTDGQTVRQLGYKVVDGAPSALFVFDLDTGRQENLDTSPDLAESTLTATFPASALEGLGDAWTWRSAVNVDGNDVDLCPEG